MKSQLNLHLFGTPQFTWQDKPISGFISNKARALLIYLAVTGRVHSRDALSELLWADTPTTKRENLKKVLSNLRKMDGVTLIEEGRHTVELDPNCYWLDVHEFATAADQDSLTDLADVERIASLYESDFLSGFNLSLSLEFEEWALSEQAQLKVQMLDLLNRLADEYRQQNLLPKAISALRQLLKIEPWQEENHRRLIELLVQNGDVSGALSHFEICRENMRTELDVEPSAATLELVEQIRNGTLAPKASYRPPKPQHPLSSTPPSKTKVEFSLVGRANEWQIVRTVWQGLERSHFICIGGEAGIGKTRLAEELLLLAESNNASIARTRSHELQGQLAFGPITDWLRSVPLQSALNQIDDVWRTEIARLLPELLVNGLAEPKPMKEGWQRKHFFDALVHAFTATDGPLLLVLDDLQWTDSDTLEWIQYLIESSDAPILIVGTARINEINPDHPLHRVRQHLQRQDKFTAVNLSELTAEATNQLAATVVEQCIEDEIAQQLFTDTAGNPLFVIESMRAEPSSSVTAEPSISVYPQPESAQSTVSIPAKIYSVIQSRLTQLSPQAQHLAQLCAAIGRAFDATLLAKATDSDENVVLILLDEMWQRRIIKEVDAVHFDFSHDRIRDVAYAEIGPIKRRVLHRNVASSLEVIHAGNTESIAAQVAVHYETARSFEHATSFYQQAANVARRVLAHGEALNYRRSSLDMLRQLPRNLINQQLEIDVLLDLFEDYSRAKGLGIPPAQSCITEAHELAMKIGNPMQQVQVLSKLANYNRTCGNWIVSGKYADEASMVAAEADIREPAILAKLRFSVATAQLRQGKSEKASKVFKQVHHMDFEDMMEKNTGHLTRYAYCMWLLGFVDKARKLTEQCLDIRKDTHYRFLCIALHHCSSVFVFCGDSEQVEKLSAELVAVATKRNDDFFLRWGLIYRGWLLVQEGGLDEGIAIMRENADEHRSRNNYFYECIWRSLLAEAYLTAGNIDAALKEIDDTLAFSKRSGDVHWNAQLLKQKGDCLLTIGSSDSVVKEQYELAVDTARNQKSRSLELRSTISLARLLQKQGNVEEAHKCLSAIYNWFTEGFDTADLIEAKTLLDELRLSVPAKIGQREHA